MKAAEVMRQEERRVPLPRVGFVGVGWIGRARLDAVVRAKVAEVVAVADVSERAAREAASGAGCDVALQRLEDVLALEPDGVVIATPSALHAQQAIAALRAGAAVFVQKPLGRTAAEQESVLAAAASADRLLGIDLSYRYADAFARAVDVVRSGDLGRVYAAGLQFHNSYGPDKPWFTDPELSGGGCLIDLGTHLIDLALTALDVADVQRVEGRLFRRGEALAPPCEAIEDHALVRFDAGGCIVDVSCSWWTPLGRDAVITATFFGSDGVVSVRNVGGSFYDFGCELYRGCSAQVLSEPPDRWGGRALVEWCRRVARDPSFDPAIHAHLATARVIDEVYGR